MILFQAYWLRKVYSEQKELLEKDIDNRFVQNIRDLQDSLYRHNWLVLRDSFRQQTTAVAIQIRTDSSGPVNAAPQQTIFYALTATAAALIMGRIPCTDGTGAGKANLNPASNAENEFSGPPSSPFEIAAKTSMDRLAHLGSKTIRCDWQY
ncbi:MAG: hypothetical protein IPK21_08845 [Haliscomenobacter sp.]|nr:hypothetical protein [Haliscomenobacter sp.]